VHATKICDAESNQLDPPETPWIFRAEVVEALFAGKKILGPTAQAKALRLHRSHWDRIRKGEVAPSVFLVLDLAALLGTTVEAIYGRRS
jgi:hypothetical protein